MNDFDKLLTELKSLFFDLETKDFWELDLKKFDDDLNALFKKFNNYKNRVLLERLSIHLEKDKNKYER